MISDLDTLARLLLAAVLGSLIGFERERLLWAAGIRTHMLVCVSACLLMIISAYGFQHALRMDHVVLDPSRIAAQVVSGIGFLAAGSILLRGQVVRGLTTAASVWAVAAIGLAAGGGLFFAAILSTVIILGILVGVKPLEEAYRARTQSCVLKISSERAAFTVDELKAVLGVRGGQIKRVLTMPGNDELDHTSVYLVRVSSEDISAGAARLKVAPGIHAIEVIKKFAAADMPNCPRNSAAPACGRYTSRPAPPARMKQTAVNQSLIRNFSIIAHIDHGKSTLADRFIQLCGGLEEREMQAQVLDNNPIERERGITIKAQAVSLNYKAHDGKIYQLNLIDTPGHVDFSYEVSRSLAACEGALLVVDASQGVEAQSVANCYTALEQKLEVLTVLNKIDLQNAEPDRVAQEIEDIIGIEATDALRISAKTGLGVPEVLEEVVRRLPPPKGDPDAPLQALIVDSWFDNYLGVVSLIRVVNGRIQKGQKIRVISTGKDYEVTILGVHSPKRVIKNSLETGEVGFLVAGIKDIYGAPVGDTLTEASRASVDQLPGFRKVQPRVFAGMFPVDADDFEDFRESLQKLRLNDSALQFEPENSTALGFGFRIGFLGMLHMEIVQERLEREYNLNLITTAPSVVYEIELNGGEIRKIDNPSDLPEPGAYADVREPIILCRLLMPQTYVGAVMQLCMEKRGVQKNLRYHGNQVQLEVEMPLAEVVLDFFDRLKSVSRGFASFEYEFLRFQTAPLVKLDVLVNGDKVDALATIVHRDAAYNRGRDLCERMQEVIHRQMFDVAIQAAIGAKIISRSTVKALRKDVTAKCYGGDVSRKRKLLDKQKEGKKRMKQVGAVEIPQEAFLAVLGVDRRN